MGRIAAASSVLLVVSQPLQPCNQRSEHGFVTLPPRRRKDRSPTCTPTGNQRSGRRRSGETGPDGATHFVAPTSACRIHFHRYWTGVRLRKGRSLYTKGRRRRWLHRKPLRPFGYRLLNEAAGRHTVCFNTQIGRAGKRGGLGKRLMARSKCKASPTQARRVGGIFPPRSGLVQVEVPEVSAAINARARPPAFLS